MRAGTACGEPPTLPGALGRFRGRVRLHETAVVGEVVQTGPPEPEAVAIPVERLLEGIRLRMAQKRVRQLRVYGHPVGSVFCLGRARELARQQLMALRLSHLRSFDRSLPA